MSNQDAKLGYYAVNVGITRRDGTWTFTRHLPTFYLHSNVQGFMDEAGAERVARSMMVDALNLPDPDVTAVHVTCVHIGENPWRSDAM